MPDDSTLLHRYATTRDEAAFAELVQRHIALVHSAASRQLAGDTHLARDATQLVFIALARKARSLVHHPLLAGWLYTATHHAAAKLVRSEQRRRAHENTARAMSDFTSPVSPEPMWEKLRPLLDAALWDLGETDRAAVLLRYFENRPFDAVGARLRLSEDAARKRVERALDKLHAAFSRRGIASTSAALATVLSTHGIQAAPAGLASAVSTIALKTAANAGLVASAAAFFPTAKIQLGLTAVLAAATVTAAIRQEANASALGTEVALLAAETQRVTASNVTARNRVTALRSSTKRNSSFVVRSQSQEEELEKTFQALRKSYDRIWAPLIRRLHLEPETVTNLLRLKRSRDEALRFAKILAQDDAPLSKALAETHADILLRAVAPEFAPRFHELLGDAGAAYFDEFERTWSARSDLSDFAQTTASTEFPLDDAQMDALAAMLTGARIERGDLPAERGAPLPEIFLVRASTILSPPQHEKLAALQSARLARREIEARNRVAASQGSLPLSAASALIYLPSDKTPSHP